MADGVASTFFDTFWGRFWLAHVCVRMGNGVIFCPLLGCAMVMLSSTSRVD